MDKISNHMVSGNFSIPQLILKDILEFMLSEKCIYNDRTAIKPLEIDCYFPKWKIGWEYNGRYFHNNPYDKMKERKCQKKGIILFNINENNNDFRKYEKNIKNQLILQIDKINKITNLSISSKDIVNYTPKIIYPNLLTLKEKKEVYNTKMSEIKTSNFELFTKIKKYKLFDDKSLGITNDLPKYNKFENFNEYKEYLINKNYQSFNELCKYEHPHRLIKKWGISIKLIHDLF